MKAGCNLKYILLILISLIYTINSFAYTDLFPHNAVWVGKSGYIYVQNKKTIVQNGQSETNYSLEATTIQCPQYLFDNYMIGNKCYKSGSVMISIGCAITAVGAIITAINAQNSHDYNLYSKGYTAGTTLMGIGGSLISVSVPLLCWGDHIKRESNVQLQMYHDFNRK